MIVIYHEHDSAALQTVVDRRLSCKATWVETNARNLGYAVGAIAYAPWVWPSGGKIQVEIDGRLFEVDQLPRYGSDLRERCQYWLDDLRRSQVRSAGPVFGL